ncbi:MAG TPA: peptidase S8 [Pseudonocardiaceae bacterium]|nr:peptidase S8 [Pseudonocardiaceae bacterium]
MNSTHRLRAVLIGVVGVVTVAISTLAPVASASAATPATHGGRSNVRDVCGPAAPGFARCYAEVRTDVHGGYGVRGKAAHDAALAALPEGYGPADLHSAYNLPMAGGAGQTVGIVDAGDDPNAEADLAVYRSTYGLPPCTTANGCFRKVNQEGQTSPLPDDWGWGIEIALDLDMVSAACPECHIVLVEGDEPSFDALGTAENTAVRLGATEVSNSYGASEFNGMDAYQADYTHPGVAIVASSGDYGYNIPSMPSVFPAVTAVGGTSLTKASNARGWTESAWAGATSGCSAYEDKPSYQTDPNCPGRMISDVSSVADPDTPPAIYDSYDGGGWTTVGGTSAASPFIAGVIGLAGNPGQFGNGEYFYSHAADLNDVVGGNNAVSGIDCGGDYQCNGVPGYDGPTGNGTPNGLGAF